MRQLGIEACIGTGVARIFFDNARKNALALPVVTAEERDALMQLAGMDSQSVLSERISALEHELGARLFFEPAVRSA